jgi:hypothetical protein
MPRRVSSFRSKRKNIILHHSTEGHELCSMNVARNTSLERYVQYFFWLFFSGAFFVGARMIKGSFSEN